MDTGQDIGSRLVCMSVSSEARGQWTVDKG
jgi:hypothetical protein